MKIYRLAGIALASALGLASSTTLADEAAGPITVTHYVPVKSTAPAIAGQDAEIYVREVAPPGALRGGPAKVVLFIHGALTPGSASFDIPYKDYSWMGYLANAGYDTFMLDLTGYGYSTKPLVMNNVCNLAKAAQAQFVPGVIPAPCDGDYAQAVANATSDWDDIAAVVEHLRALRHVDKISIVAWSQGGPRSVGYILRNPTKVDRLVLLAPLYNRTTPTDDPKNFQADRGIMGTQTKEQFAAGLMRGMPPACGDTYEQGTIDAVWKTMIDADPVGATWGAGVRRSPSTPYWGFNKETVARLQVPVLALSGQNDVNVPQDRVREFYADAGSKEKVFVDVACSSHYLLMQKNHLLLFQASLQWLRDGKVNGMTDGMIKLGY